MLIKLSLLLLAATRLVISDKRFGSFLGEFNKYAHKVTGKVYAIDENKLYIRNFTYDGLGPDAYFWIGKEANPSPNGILVPYPELYRGSNPPVLRDFDNEELIVTLPSEYTISDLSWISVWCRRFTVNFADLKITDELKSRIPKRRVLPEFKRLAHGLKSGNITILDSKTFYIPNLYYDGAGPDAYFWVGTGASGPHAGGRKIPNEVGSLEVLRGYQGEDIELKLPGSLTVYDIDWLGVWCVAYKHDFGHVFIPKDILVPPNMEEVMRRIDDNNFNRQEQSINLYGGGLDYGWGYHDNRLETIPFSGSFNQHSETGSSGSHSSKPSNHGCIANLLDNVKLKYKRSPPDYIEFDLTADIEPSQWVSIGFSPMDDRVQMVGADAIVCWYDESGTFHADDYFLSAKSQCDGASGSCPDLRVSGGNDVQVISGEKIDESSVRIKFKRPIEASDRNLDLDLEDRIVFVAIGNLNARNEVNYHFGLRSTAPYRLNFTNECGKNRKNGGNRRNGQNKLTAWEPYQIDATQNFTAVIGPTGGKRGYSAITGHPSWGIAWWINGYLIPELYVERGKTYYFKVHGGLDPTNPAKYHPFYITSSHEGGYGQKSAVEQMQQIVYAGVAFDKITGRPRPTGVGAYCEYEHKTIDQSSKYEDFNEWKSTLVLNCRNETRMMSDERNVIVWKVDYDTPDLVYYQCYTHNNLGWKIHVVDQGFQLKRKSYSSKSRSLQSQTSFNSLSLLALVVAFISTRSESEM